MIDFLTTENLKQYFICNMCLKPVEYVSTTHRVDYYDGIVFHIKCHGERTCYSIDAIELSNVRNIKSILPIRVFENRTQDFLTSALFQVNDAIDVYSCSRCNRRFWEDAKLVRIEEKKYLCNECYLILMPKLEVPNINKIANKINTSRYQRKIIINNDK